MRALWIIAFVASVGCGAPEQLKEQRAPQSDETSDFALAEEAIKNRVVAPESPPTAFEEPPELDFENIPFRVPSTTIIHRHNPNDPSWFGRLQKFSPWDGLVHSHALQFYSLRLDRDLPVWLFLRIPGAVVRTPEDHIFEIRRADALDKRVSPSPFWTIQSPEWGIVEVSYRYDAGLIIRSHPTPVVSNQLPKTTHTEFNAADVSDPKILLGTWDLS